jgi:imidazolonepropionase-like amidohydrolase
MTMAPGFIDCHNHAAEAMRRRKPATGRLVIEQLELARINPLIARSRSSRWRT